VVETVRLGLSIRALRRRRDWTQADLGRRVGVSGSVVSRIERGSVGRITVRRLEAVLEALGARLHLKVLWQGEELDRLLDRNHATMVDAVLRFVGSHGWIAIPEVTFAIWGERGSVDILAWHPATRTLLVIEIKTVVPDIQATAIGIDRKARIAPELARERGWVPRTMGRLLVLPADRTARRRVDAFAATFDRVLPLRTAAVKRWLSEPTGAMAGILFLSGLPVAQARQRIRRSSTRAERERA
jgi:transcriptional regulator with XRE-family HTH domain